MMKVLHLNNLSCWWQICNKIFFCSLQWGHNFSKMFCEFDTANVLICQWPKLYVCKMCWFSGKNKIIFHDWLHFFARVLTCKMGSKHLWICNRIFLTHFFLTSQGLKVYKVHISWNRTGYKNSKYDFKLSLTLLCNNSNNIFFCS